MTGRISPGGQATLEAASASPEMGPFSFGSAGKSSIGSTRKRRPFFDPVVDPDHEAGTGPKLDTMTVN